MNSRCQNECLDLNFNLHLSLSCVSHIFQYQQATYLPCNSSPLNIKTVSTQHEKSINFNVKQRLFQILSNEIRIGICHRLTSLNMLINSNTIFDITCKPMTVVMKGLMLDDAEGEGILNMCQTLSISNMYYSIIYDAREMHPSRQIQT